MQIFLGLLVLVLSIAGIVCSIRILIQSVRKNALMSFPLSDARTERSIFLESGKRYGIIYEAPQFTRIPWQTRPYIHSATLPERRITRSFPVGTSRFKTAATRVFDFTVPNDGHYQLFWKVETSLWYQKFPSLKRLLSAPISDRITVHVSNVAPLWQTLIVIPLMILSIWGIILSVFITTGIIDELLFKLFEISI